MQQKSILIFKLAVIVTLTEVLTTTTMHIDEFEAYVDSLTDLDQQILNKYNLQK